ncbi:MAG TPA: autotransporter-associated beta strand repeat-containing protein [Rhizomicrobium sp.]|jgi:autotransporter-associated beta strand protein
MSTLKWKTATSGNFNDAARWDTGHAPGAGDVANIGLAGSYTVTIDSADTAGTINFSAAGATLMETGTGSLTLDVLKLSAGTVALQNANTIGNYVFQTGGQLQFSNSNSLGTATDFLSAGEQTAMASATLANTLSLFQGGAATTAIIDAAAGQTLDIGSGGWTFNDAGVPTLQFGSASETGTVIWHSTSGTVTGGGAYKLNVAGGTLQVGDGAFTNLTMNANNTTVAAGATLDVAGNNLTFHNLIGAGSVIDSGANTAIELSGANFSGTIGGGIEVLAFNNVVLGGTNTYSLGTIVESGAVLGVSSDSALGSGTLSLDGGELLATAADVSLSNNTAFYGANTVAAATGHTLTLASATMDWDGNVTPFSVTFGDATHKGTVVLAPVAETEEPSTTPRPIDVTVADGILQFGAANGNANALLNNIDTITVAAGATLDVNGNGFDPNTTVIAGTLTNSSATAAIFYSFVGSTVSGAITGNLQVAVETGTMTLTGTNSYTGGTTIGSELDLGNGGAGGNILAGSAIADDGLLVDDHSSADTLSGIISGTGNFTKNGTGATTLSGVNTYTGTTTLNSGTLIVTNNASLGDSSSTISLNGGELLATGNATFTQQSALNGDITFAAASGKTLTFNPSTINWGATSVTIGDSTHAGTVVLGANGGSASGTTAFDVADGTVQAGNSDGAQLLSDNASLSVAAGATLDTNGFSVGSSFEHTTVIDGTLTNSSATAGAFDSLGTTSVSGSITGNLSVEVGTGTLTLTGTSTYTNGTTIDVGAELDLGNGGAGGKILSGTAIVDNGSLVDNHSSGEVLGGIISGTGSFTKNGTGATTLSGSNTYSGGTTLNGGTLTVTNNNSLGASSGAISLTGGELLASANVSLAQSMTFTGSTTVAAATGQTLTLGLGSMSWDGSSAPLNITFGDATHKGTVILGATGLASVNDTHPITATVADGTLQFGSDGDFFLQYSQWTVDAGATLDANGSPLYGTSAIVKGTATNSSATAEFFYSNGSTVASGAITGNLGVEVVTGTMTLTGANSYTGGTFINLSAELDLGNGGAGGSILAGSPIADAGLLVDNHSSNDILSGLISGAGSFTKSGTGATTLSGANTYSGGTTINSGTLIATNASSLGSGGTINLKGGELVTNVDMTLAQGTTFSGSATVAAVTGTTLTLASSKMVWDDGAAPVSITFGDATHKGTIVLAPTSDGPVLGQPVAVTAASGIVRLGSSAASDLFSGASVTVGAAARLDLHGFDFAPVATTITGILTNTSTTAAEFESHGTSTASGVINGNLDLLVYSGSMTLTGANTYTGGTTIDSGATLNLGNGGTGGSLLAGSAIVDNGVLTDNQSSADTISGIISGTGKFNKSGTGTTTLSGLNTYSGTTTLSAGELIAANVKALGTGALVLTGGELLGTANMVQSHALHTSGTDTIAAAHGTNFVLSATNAIIDAGKLIIGDSAGDDGMFTFRDSGALTISDAAHTTVEVQAGTLIAGSDGALSTLLKGIAGTAIDSGAILDENGHALSITALTGTGTLTNSGASAVTSLYGMTNFAGAITGTTTVDVFANTALTGNETFTGALNIEGAFAVRLGGLFAETVNFTASGATLVLTTPANFTGLIGGFQSGTAIDLRNITFAAGDTLAYNTTTHILTVSDGTNTDQLHFNGSFVQGNFGKMNDSNGHLDVIWQTAPAAPHADVSAASTHDTSVADLSAIDFNHQIQHTGDWIG